MSILEGKFLKFDKCPALNNCTGTKNFLNPILGAQIQTSYRNFQITWIQACLNIFLILANVKMFFQNLISILSLIRMSWEKKSLKRIRMSWTTIREVRVDCNLKYWEILWLNMILLLVAICLIYSGHSLEWI